MTERRAVAGATAASVPIPEDTAAPPGERAGPRSSNLSAASYFVHTGLVGASSMFGFASRSNFEIG